MITSLPHKERLRLLQHQPRGPLQLGCGCCPHLGLCGGISLDYAVMSCRDLCECADGSDCSAVCPKHPERYFKLINEVDGFDLMSLPIAPVIKHVPLPDYVPMVYSRSSRSEPLLTPVVAIPLAAVFSQRTGLLRFDNRKALLESFRVDPSARVIFSGVDEDFRIEPYWSQGRDAGLVKALSELKPDMVTVPNFSLLSNVPRHDNLVNMKRIAIAWLEMAFAGISSALHVHARTDRDWERWAEFITHQAAVRTVSFEFATGARINRRGEWFAERLSWLAKRVGRPLHLVMRGTTHHEQLRQAFDGVTIIDTSAYAKATRRFKAFSLSSGRVRWHRSFTLQDQPIDHILQHNVDVCCSTYSGSRHGQSSAA